MNIKIIGIALLSLIYVACSNSHEGHNHEVESHEGHDHDEEILEGHDHSSEVENHEEHEEIKFQYTSYSADFELFAEADAFIVGEKANVLSHFSELPDFTAVEQGKITIVLSINGKETKQTLDEPTRKGIYSFDIEPETKGTGKLTFEITNGKGIFEVIVPNVTVFSNHEDAIKASESIVISQTNTTVFTKEQSWKIEFATAPPISESFGQVIKTTALVQSEQISELVVTAKTNGLVTYTTDAFLEGKEVLKGQALFLVSGGNLSDNNISVKYAEAKSNFEKADADYKRAVELAKDNIVSQKDLFATKNQYENAKSVYNNLNENFNSSGQTITSPKDGFIKQIFVKNGEFVVAGQPIAIVSQNNVLNLKAEVPSRYAKILPNIKSANIRAINGKHTYSLEQLNGRILSFGKATNTDNFLIPVNVQIENNGDFVAGNFVELYLKEISTKQKLVVPSTALLEEQGNYFVWVQVTPELFEKREVHIGATDRVNTELIKGIIADDRVVIRGAMLIKLAQATSSLDAHSGHVH
jgi:RND family efflux transporter MFP subunit